jgi:hypothetical protein
MFFPPQILVNEALSLLVVSLNVGIPVVLVRNLIGTHGLEKKSVLMNFKDFYTQYGNTVATG